MKPTTSLIILGVSTIIPTQANSLQIQENVCSDVRYPPPSVRSPPEEGYQGHNFASWTPPPPEHLYGIYYVSHTSINQSIAPFANLQTERYPVYPNEEDHPAGSQVDITSWSACVDPKASECEDPNGVKTIFGYNLPIGAQGPTDRVHAAAWMYNATGMLAGKVSNLFAIIAWGVDHNGSDYFAQYETNSEAVATVSNSQTSGIKIASRSEKGIDRVTYICLSSSLKQLAEELGDTELSTTVSRIKPVHTDDRRTGEGPVACDAMCVDNTNTVTRKDGELQRRSMQWTQIPLNIVDTHKRMYRIGGSRSGHLPWWGWLTIGLVFGIPLLGGLCVAVPIALCKGHRRRKLARTERSANGPGRNHQSSSVVEPETVQVA